MHVIIVALTFLIVLWLFEIKCINVESAKGTGLYYYQFWKLGIEYSMVCGNCIIKNIPRVHKIAESGHNFV